ncbi:copper resistance protein CopC [Nocardioides marmoriginsengisoli]|uniref:Copper resistance protein CopC n=1 Tax=Nocardioides marmoriginsengisoli TaxID=661483 RepID=A0A3N0CCU2_9ACTN|nr:copper resistance protein CopC [Nocardioides marmoriginsengisoli]RNL61277.1 copper resistance protein CopC [Nocardioides marmoriginsengisoli]
MASGQSRARAVRRLVLAAALALLGLLAFAGPASAHATLVGTDPTEGQILTEAPEKATFTFDEPVRAQSGGVHLFDAKGVELEADTRTTDTLLVVDLPEGLADGTYVIAWRVVSSDGHPIAGALTFSIGAPSATVAAATGVSQSSPTSVRASLGIAQALTYLGVFGACGLVAFVLLLLPKEGGLDQVRERLLRIAGRFAWLVVVAGFATLVLTTLYQRAEGFSALFTDGPYEIPTGTELVSWVLAALGAWIAVGFAQGVRGRVHRVPALAGVVLALGALALVGHTRAFPPLWVMIAADLSHVLAGSIWFGGLIGLVISLRRLADRPRVAAVALGRFSALAAWLLVAVAVTGSVLGWRILRSWGNLFGTDFGRLLLVKVAVVVLVALIAAWNRYRLMPAVLADSGFADRASATGRLQRTVRIEAVLLIGVLGLTGFLVDRSPVEDTGSVALPGALDSSTFAGQTGNAKVVAVLKPATVGKNTILFQVQDLAGNPMEPSAVPGLNATSGQLSLGEQEVTNVDSGTYAATVVLPRAGTWDVQVSVRMSEFENPVVTVKVPVAAPR